MYIWTTENFKCRCECICDKALYFWMYKIIIHLFFFLSSFYCKTNKQTNNLKGNPWRISVHPQTVSTIPWNSKVIVNFQLDFIFSNKFNFHSYATAISVYLFRRGDIILACVLCLMSHVSVFWEFISVKRAK